MGRPRKIENMFNAPKSNVQFSEGQKSKGILDDFAVRKNIDSMEGTIQQVPTNADHIVNKAYADGLVGGATGSFVATSGETITVVNGLVTLINTVTFLILLETGDSILMENDDRMENA